MKNASQILKTDDILAARAIYNLHSCYNFALELHENALVFSQSDARTFSMSITHCMITV